MRQFLGVNCLKGILWKVLITFCVCIRDLDGVSLRQNVIQQLSHQGDVLVYRRQEATPTSPPEGSTNIGAGDFFASYWFIFVVLLLFVVIVTVFVCACVVKVRKRNHHSGSLELSRRSPASGRSFHQQRSVDEHSLPQHTTGSSSMAGGSPISLSVGPTPIPSPQPSAASSQRSYRSQGGKRRRNHSSGHVSSSSDETIRAHDFYSSTSLMSHSSSQGGVHPRVARTESLSSGDRHYRHASGRRSRHKRTTSNPHIKVLPSDDPAFYSAPSSMHSMESVSLSQRSSHSNSQRTLVDVDVTVHLGAENDHETRKEIAAALAESARKLAQSAANFDQEDSFSSQGRPQRSSSQLSHRGSSLQSRRQLFPTHSSSISLGHEGGGGYRSYSPIGPPTVSLDRRGLERPHNTFPTRTELVRRNSLSRAPPPESPLRISHSKYLSQRSLSNEKNPTTAKLPVHMRINRIRSLDDQPSALSQREISLDNLHDSPSPPHPILLAPKAVLQDNSSVSIAPPPPQMSASLDFSGMQQSLSTSLDGMQTANGLHSSRSQIYSRNEGVHFTVDSDHGISPDSGMGNGDYGTGTESSSSTLRSSHKRDRLSRLSEKSVEYLNCEDGEAPTEKSGAKKRPLKSTDNIRKSSRSGGDVSNGFHARDREMATITASADTRRKSNGVEQSIDTDSSTQGSEASLDENSTGSGYAATGSASSVDSKISHDSHTMQNGITSQFSYPLEKLLAQPLCCEIDCDDIGTGPLPLPVAAPRHEHYHHENTLSYNGTHSSCQIQKSASYNVHRKNGYSLDSRKRTHSESKLVAPQLGYHRNQAIGDHRFQSGSIAVDV